MLDIAECALAALKLVSLLFGFIEGGARQCLGPMETASSSVISVVKKKKKRVIRNVFWWLLFLYFSIPCLVMV